MIALAKQFVPATGEVWRLQRCSDPDCLFFQELADQGHYGDKDSASRQGTYVCAASGKFLASINSNNPDRVLETMEAGLAAWQKLPPAERKLTDDSRIQPKHRWEDSYPRQGLALTMFTRDLPSEGGPDQDPASKWNQDHAWFSKTEARQWLPTSMRVGESHELPAALLRRLAQYHLVDTVKGQTSVFSKDDIQDSHIRVNVVSVTDSQATLQIEGKTLASSDRRARRTSPHGVSTQLRGNATFDLTSGRFTQFELVAIGKRWGHTRFNGRHRDPAEGRLGFVFRLTTDQEPRIAPTFLSQYDANWVVQPKQP